MRFLNFLLKACKILQWLCCDCLGSLIGGFFIILFFVMAIDIISIGIATIIQDFDMSLWGIVGPALVGPVLVCCCFCGWWMQSGGGEEILTRWKSAYDECQNVERDVEAQYNPIRDTNIPAIRNQARNVEFSQPNSRERQLPPHLPDLNKNESNLANYNTLTQSESSSTFYYSEISPSIPLSHNNWVVSILRHPNSNNPDHAVLVVEGMNGKEQGVLWKYHFVALGQGQVIVKEQNVPMAERKTTLMSKEILNVPRHGEFYAISWSIQRNQALRLKADVLRDHEQPPVYQYSGDKSIFVVSTSQEAHNCFTWAREKLHNLNDERIQLPLKYTDFIGTKTSFYITGPESQKKFCKLM